MKAQDRRLGGIGPIVLLGFVLVPISSCAGPAPLQIEIQLFNVPAIVTVGQAVSLTANVANDLMDAGIDWSCGSGTCGAFAPSHTASAAITVFTAPSTPGPVTVTAAASADGSVTASHTLSVVPADSNARLNGTYVFTVQGVEASGRFAAVGAIVADGNGHITGGQQDYAGRGFHAGPDPVTGVYAVGPDGRGSITLTVNNPSLPQAGVETFGIALTSNTHALIIHFGGAATSSGHLDAQAAGALDPAAISGAFAFTSMGFDFGNNVPITRGGVLRLDAAAGTVSSGVYYANDGGATFSSGTSGTMTAPDGLGRGTIALDLNVTFAYYAVQGQVLRLVEAGPPSVMTAGSICGQGDAGANATFSNASLEGNYVFFESGGTGYGPLALAGQFTSDGAGNFTSGVTQLNHAGVVSFALIDGPSRYALAANGIGSLDLPLTVDQRGAVSALMIFAVSPAINLFDPGSATDGGGALVMDYDSGAVAAGYIMPQSAGTFDGDYALDLQFFADTGENDWVGRAAASGGAFAGTVDVNVSGRMEAGLALAGSYSADRVNPGRWAGTVIVNDVVHGIAAFQVSGNISVILATDAVEVGIGLLEKQSPGPSAPR